MPAAAAVVAAAQWVPAAVVAPIPMLVPAAAAAGAMAAAAVAMAAVQRVAVVVAEWVDATTTVDPEAAPLARGPAALVAPSDRKTQADSTHTLNPITPNRSR